MNVFTQVEKSNIGLATKFMKYRISICCRKHDATYLMSLTLRVSMLQAGLALGQLQSIGDLYDFNSIATLFFIGIVSITPTLVGKDKS